MQFGVNAWLYGKTTAKSRAAQAVAGGALGANELRMVRVLRVTIAYWRRLCSFMHRLERYGGRDDTTALYGMHYGGGCYGTTAGMSCYGVLRTAWLICVVDVTSVNWRLLCGECCCE